MKDTKLKKKDAINLLEQNNSGILNVCYNNIPYSYPICYDTDSFCGCTTIYFKVKKCSKLADILKNNNIVSLNINSYFNNNCWLGCNNNLVNITALGEANLIENNNDCCNPKDDCFITYEVCISDIEARIGYCNN